MKARALSVYGVLAILPFTWAVADAGDYKIDKDTFAVTVKRLAVMPVGGSVKASVADIVRDDERTMQWLDSMVLHDKEALMAQLQRDRRAHYAALQPLTNPGNSGRIDSIVGASARLIADALHVAAKITVIPPESTLAIAQRVRPPGCALDLGDTNVVRAILDGSKSDGILALSFRVIGEKKKVIGQYRVLSDVFKYPFAMMMEFCVVGAGGDTLWYRGDRIRTISQGGDIGKLFDDDEIRRAAKNAIKSLTNQ